MGLSTCHRTVQNVLDTLNSEYDLPLKNFQRVSLPEVVYIIIFKNHIQTVIFYRKGPTRSVRIRERQRMRGQ